MPPRILFAQAFVLVLSAVLACAVIANGSAALTLFTRLDGPRVGIHHPFSDTWFPQVSAGLRAVIAWGAGVCLWLLLHVTCRLFFRSSPVISITGDAVAVAMLILWGIGANAVITYVMYLIGHREGWGYGTTPQDNLGFSTMAIGWFLILLLGCWTGFEIHYAKKNGAPWSKSLSDIAHGNTYHSTRFTKEDYVELGPLYDTSDPEPAFRAPSVQPLHNPYEPETIQILSPGGASEPLVAHAR